MARSTPSPLPPQSPVAMLSQQYDLQVGGNHRPEHLPYPKKGAPARRDQIPLMLRLFPLDSMIN